MFRLSSSSLIVVIVLLLSMFFSQYGNSQTDYYHIFNQANGLNSNTIYSIYEDTDGFLWVGTETGLLKYNGNSFKEIGLPNPYPSLEVYKIWEHPDGGVWVSNTWL